MAFIKTTAPSDATGETRAMYARQQAAYGYVPNYAKVFCHRPEVMKLWADLLYGIRRNLDRRRLELVTLAAAHEVRSSYCSLAHGKALT
jgi:alkylhydroperoxidase family enzyme